MRVDRRLTGGSTEQDKACLRAARPTATTAQARSSSPSSSSSAAGACAESSAAPLFSVGCAGGRGRRARRAMRACPLRLPFRSRSPGARAPRTGAHNDVSAAPPSARARRAPTGHSTQGGRWMESPQIEIESPGGPTGARRRTPRTGWEASSPAWAPLHTAYARVPAAAVVRGCSTGRFPTSRGAGLLQPASGRPLSARWHAPVSAPAPARRSPSLSIPISLVLPCALALAPCPRHPAPRRPGL